MNKIPIRRVLWTIGDILRDTLLGIPQLDAGSGAEEKNEPLEPWNV